ncbi:MAG: DUF167 family protein [Gammaproteobacteria bacterium]|nr:DUF167 family protein [Gammaproteobacteria bacterium]
MSNAWRWDGDALLLALHVQPRAGKEGWMGEHDGALKLRIAAPPVDGKANAAVEKFLCREFGVNRSSIQLLSGQAARRKRFRIESPRTLPDGITRSPRGNPP